MELEYLNSLLKQDSIVKDENSRRLQLQILLLQDKNDELHRHVAAENERNKQLVAENERKSRQLAIENERSKQQLVVENERKSRQLAIEKERSKQQPTVENMRNAQKKSVVPTPIIIEEAEPKKKKRKIFGPIKTIFDEDYYEADKRPTKIALAPALAKPGGNMAFLHAGKMGVSKGEIEFSPLKKDKRGAKAGFLGVDPGRPL
jgi:type IV secretory pathway VirJ component